MKLLTSDGLDMAVRHAIAESERFPVRQRRKRFEMFSTGLWDGVRLYNSGDYDGEIESGDTLVVKVHKNLGTRKYPDVRVSYIVVRVKEVCERFIRYNDDFNIYHVYPDAVLAVVRG